MPKILLSNRYTGRPWEMLQSVVPNGYTIKTLDCPNKEQLIEEIVDADYLLVSGRLKIDQEVLENAFKLKMMQRTGVGTEMLDLDAISRKGIPVYVNAGVNARSVAEHTLTLILSCLKRITIINQQVHAGIWKKQETGTTCHELFGKTVGLVGMGAIGRLVAKYLKCFGAKVIYTDIIQLSQEQERELGISFFPFTQPFTLNNQLLAQSDILSFHCPLTRDNTGILNSTAIAHMKDGAIVINTARGQLINELDLYNGLKSGKLASAGLDVRVDEPIKQDNALSVLDNVIQTPHIAGLSYETFLSMMRNAVSNIVAFENEQFDQIELSRLI